MTGDWNGDGRTDVGVFDDGTWTLRLREGGGIAWAGTVVFGGSADLPVVGDWDGERRHRPRHLDAGHGDVHPAQGIRLVHRTRQSPTGTPQVGIPR